MSNKSKSNGGSKQASVSTSLYSNEQTTITKQRQRSSSALPTFFRWFKKSNHRKSSSSDKNNETYFSSTSSAIETLNYDSYSSRDSLSPSSSPRLGHQQRYNNHINNFKNKNNINDHLSPSISCDSVISTSTTGFAFIRPNNYRPNGDAEEPKILIDNGPDTDSIQRRMKIYNTNCFPSSNENDSNKRPEISLRRKYFLYGHSDTIRSNNIYQNHNSFAAGDRLELSGNYDNVNYLDYSLPNIGNNHQIDRNSNESNIQQIINTRRGQRQRRTVSDSSKDKKSGAYVHVKGKRKAPDPPTTNCSIYETPLRDNRQYRTLTPLSTLGRKKRKAPQPPIRFSTPTSSISSPPTSSLSSPSEELANSILSEGLLDDKDIKAIIDGTDSNNLNQSNMSFSTTSNGNISESMSNPTSPIHKLSSSINGHLSDPTSPASPISLRPWYKRSITTNRDSVIPFKREIVLRTMEKRKGKQKEQPILPDVSYSRSSTSSSIFDSGSKFGFFSKHKDNTASEDNRGKDNQKEKRKSGIGMPNISELDREAAEIISKEKAGLTPLNGADDDKYYKPPEHLILQQQMFESNRIEKDAKDKEKDNSEEMEETAKSTKDLISKFESSSSSPKINLNTSFIGRIENFVDTKDSPNKKNEENIKLVKEIIKLSPTYTSNIRNDNNIVEDSSTKISATENISSVIEANKSNETHEELSTGLIKMTWSCPFCTLENPNWRIICEVCERLKPYEKITNQLNMEKSSSPKFAKKLIQLTDKNVDKKSSSEVLSNSDWEKKTEKVKKYFQPRPTTPLTKSPSETSVSRKVVNKSPSPSKLPICNSPKLSRTRYQQYDQQESKSTSSSNQFKLNNKIIEEKELIKSGSDENKEPLLDKSAVTTTVTPVFYAITETANKNNIEMTKSKTDIDLEEIRNARLAKFSPNKTDNVNGCEIEVTELATSPKSLISKNNNSTETEREKSTTPVQNDNNLLINDSNLLEIEKQRLRDKIRAMNAKAMADNYPVNRNSLSVEQINIPADQPIPPQRSDKSRAKKVSELTDSNYAIPSPQTSKLGAIKKVFTKTSNSKNTKSILQTSQSNSIEDNFYAVENNKPKKVSSSAQTAGMVKKQINSDNSDAKIYVNLNKSNVESDAIYENIPTYENQIFGQSKLLDDKFNEIKTEEYIKLSDIDKEEVKEISNQLKSAEGLNDFKATLKNSKTVKSISRTDTLVLNKIMKNLEVAIFNGKHEVAAKLAMDLAKMKVQLQVTKLKKNDERKKNDEITEKQNNNVDKTIIIDMFVEDRISQKGPIQITIQPLMTIKELKLKAFKDFHIPIDLQRWLINDQLLYDDNRTLLDCGVKDKSAGLYLYIIRPPATTQQNQQNEINFKLPETSKAKPEEDDFSSSDGGNSTDSHNGTIISIDDNIKGASALAVKSESKLQPNQNQQHKEITKTVENSTWECTICTLINAPLALACSACSRAKPLSLEEKSSISEELKKFLGGNSCINSNFNNNNNNNVLNSDNLLNIRPIEKRNDLNKKSPNRKSTDIYNIIEEIIKPPEQNIIIQSVMAPSVAVVANVMTTTSIKPTNVPIKNITPKRLAPNPNITKPNIVAEIKKVPPQQIGSVGNNISSSSSASVIKSTNNNNIVSTSTKTNPSKYTANFSSPNITKCKYRGVDNFNPYRKDGTEPIPIFKNPVLTKPQQQHTSTKNDISLMLKTPYTISHYMEILKLDTTDVVRNSEPFDCPICLTKFQIGEGCVLRDCLHTFCRDCLASTIQYNEEAEIKCPYANRDYSCDSVLQEREIRSLVTLEIYEKHLAKSVRYAEHQIQNAFHCKTPNCRGWCIYEDNVNQFKCPVCRITNCLTCRVIHDGLTCKQYQDRLNTDCDSNVDAKRTKEMLSEMVDKGEAMNCPTCQVIMMKKWGCDWLKCSMCKTEVCWVTRGPRWGAAGKGDTSGGCKCGVNGVKCHPKCNYCH